MGGAPVGKIRMNKVTFRIFLILFVLCAIICAPCVWSAEVLILLHRATWSFSAEEIKTLNTIDRKVMGPHIAAIIKNATGHKDEDPLMDFKVIDLNGDGIAEVVFRTDVSGRWFARDVCVLSCSSGKYNYEIVPSYGIKITLWEKKDQKFIVGSEPVFELVRCDPILNFPEIYAWTGSKCKLVSKQHWPYYRDQFLPLLTNGISELENTNFQTLAPECKHRMAVEAVNWALATDKLNEMFPEEPAVKDSLKKTYELLNALRLEDDENSLFVRKIAKEIRNAQEKIRLRIAAGS